MKKWLLGLVLAFGVALVVGCAKQEEAGPVQRPPKKAAAKAEAPAKADEPAKAEEPVKKEEAKPAAPK